MGWTQYPSHCFLCWLVRLESMEAYKRWVRRNRDYVHSLESLANVSPFQLLLILFVFFRYNSFSGAVYVLSYSFCALFLVI